MGHNIKVGDKVRLTGEGWDEYYGGVTVGSLVEVTRITDGFIFAGDADDVGNSDGLYSVELVTPKMRFEVGDEVYDASPVKYGLGRIVGLWKGNYRIRFYRAESNGQYSSQGDAHIRKEDEVTQDCTEQDCLCRDKEMASGGYEPPTSPNAVDPDHYKFPNGAEVIQISQWLTANSAQAMQYITRSSRIDGKNKGDTLEDLEKAKVFIDFEIARLKGQK